MVEITKLSNVKEIFVVKDEINELVRACQLAKSGIVNTNLPNKAEIGGILNELEILPYGNIIEAIEYGTPSVYTNGSHLWDILSMPKTGKSNQILNSGSAKFSYKLTHEKFIELLNKDVLYVTNFEGEVKTRRVSEWYLPSSTL